MDNSKQSAEMIIEHKKFLFEWNSRKKVYFTKKHFLVNLDELVVTNVIRKANDQKYANS